jgi:hypothetical protein
MISGRSLIAKTRNRSSNPPGKLVAKCKHACMLACLHDVKMRDFCLKYSCHANMFACSHALNSAGKAAGISALESGSGSRATRGIKSTPGDPAATCRSGSKNGLGALHKNCVALQLKGEMGLHFNTTPFVSRWSHDLTPEIGNLVALQHKTLHFNSSMLHFNTRFVALQHKVCCTSTQGLLHFNTRPISAI